MTDELARLLDLPAAARLFAAGDELQVITVSHEHADRVVIDRRRFGSSIDLGELLALIGQHGLAQEAPELPPAQIQVSEIAVTQRVPELPAPVEAEPAVISDPPAYACADCGKRFASQQSLASHRKVHKMRTAASTPAAPVVPPEPAATGEHTCPECGEGFKRAQGLGAHRSRTHGVKGMSEESQRLRAARDVAPEVTAEPAPAPSTPVSPVHAFTCPACFQPFETQDGLAQHIDRVHPSRSSSVPLRTVVRDVESTPALPNDGELCEACRRPVDTHERCAECSVLLGAGHRAGPVYIVMNERSYCKACTVYRRNGKLVTTS